MPETDIAGTTVGDLGSTQTTYTSQTHPGADTFQVDPQTTDGPQEMDETRWTNQDWGQQLGYYKEVPEIQAAIDAKATWTVGKGFTADTATQLQLGEIKGWGKDTFNTILENMIRTYHIGGDAFAEIILDKNGELINLKPLDPGSMVIIANRKGIIRRYEKVSRTGKKITGVMKFKKEKIFHLSRNRVADELHGVSMIDSVKWIILALKEAMNDMKVLMHRHVKPIMVIHLDTDDPTEIAAFKVKYDLAIDKGEALYVPKGVVVPELFGTPANATLSPIPWINILTQKFNEVSGVPDIIVGSSQGLTEKASTIKYVVWQQTVEEEQLYNEEQVLGQLNLEIKLQFPASLTNDVLSDQAKDGPLNIDADNSTAQPAQPLEGETNAT